MQKALRYSSAFPKHFLKCDKKIGQTYGYKQQNEQKHIKTKSHLFKTTDLGIQRFIFISHCLSIFSRQTIQTLLKAQNVYQVLLTNSGFCANTLGRKQNQLERKKPIILFKWSAFSNNHTEFITSLTMAWFLIAF